MDTPKTRGLLHDDDKTFNTAWLSRLRAAQVELQFLLDRNYPPKSASTFVGNHHQLATRQLLALTRATAPSENLQLRKSKRLDASQLKGQTVYIDGFNLIITLEVALSNGMLFVGQDSCIRDLAELRGSYRLIPQTREAIELLHKGLCSLGVAQAVIMLDEPISNSGRLKTELYELSWNMPLEVQIVRNPDTLLGKLPFVCSSDSNILDECQNWFNLTDYLFKTYELYPRLNRLIQLNGEAI